MATSRDKALRQEAIKEEPPVEKIVMPDVIRAELFEQLRRYIQDLEPDKRESILLYYFAGMKLREIAELTGVSANAAEKRLARARETLGERILHEFSEELSSNPEEKRVARLMSAVLVAGPPNLAKVSGTGLGVGLVVKLATALLVMLALGFVGWRGSTRDSLEPEMVARVIEAETVEIPAMDVVEIPEVVDVADASMDAEALELGALVEEVIEEEISEPEPEPAAVSEGIVTGRVYDVDTKAGISEVTVKAIMAETQIEIYSEPTDADGVYTMVDIPAGVYQISQGERVGYQEDNWERDVRTVTLRGESVIENIDFALKHGTHLAGLVVDEAGGPIPFAQLLLIGGGGSVWVVERTTANENGEYDYSGLTPTTDLWLRAEKSGYSNQPHGPLIVGRDGMLGLTITMGIENNVAGILVDGNGEPLAGYDLGLNSDFDVRTGGLRVDTRNDGTFSFPNAYPGTFEVIAHPPRKGQINWQRVAVLSVESGHSYTNLRYVYDVRSDLTISGYVYDSVGKSIADQRVGYRPVEGRTATHGVKTDGEGYYIIEELSEGEYELNITLPYRKSNRSVASRRAPAGAENVDLTAYRLTTISGRVVDDSTDKPISRFEIGGTAVQEGHLTSRQMNSLYRVRDRNGDFTVENIYPGEMELFARANGYGLVSKVFVVEDGVPMENIEIRLRKDAGLRGQVVSESGSPVAGVKLFLGRLMAYAYSGVTPDVLTDAEGKFHVASLPEGEVMVSALHDDYAFASELFSIPAVDEVTLTLCEGDTIHGEIYLDGELYDGEFSASVMFDARHQDDRLKVSTWDAPGEFHISQVPDEIGKMGVSVKANEAGPNQGINFSVGNPDEVQIVEFNSGDAQIAGTLEHNYSGIKWIGMIIDVLDTPYISHQYIYHLEGDTFDLSGAPAASVSILVRARSYESDQLKGVLETTLVSGENPALVIRLESIKQ